MGKSPSFEHRANPEAGARFRDLRMKAGYTLESMAKALGTRPNLVAKYQNGGSSPSLPTATLLEQLVGMPANGWWIVESET